jgi:hypothetical protein
MLHALGLRAPGVGSRWTGTHQGRGRAGGRRRARGLRRGHTAPGERATLGPPRQGKGVPGAGCAGTAPGRDRGTAGGQTGGAQGGRAGARVGPSRGAAGGQTGARGGAGRGAHGAEQGRLVGRTRGARGGRQGRGRGEERRSSPRGSTIDDNCSPESHLGQGEVEEREREVAAREKKNV